MPGTYGSNHGTYGNESIRPDSGNPFQQGIHDGCINAGRKHVCFALCRLAVGIITYDAERTGAKEATVLFLQKTQMGGKCYGNYYGRVFTMEEDEFRSGFVRIKGRPVTAELRAVDAVFSGNPLELFTKTLYTIIDGKVVYMHEE